MKHYTYVKKAGQEKLEKHHCPQSIIQSVARIVNKRIERKSAEIRSTKSRIDLLKKIVEYEDNFVEGACKTLM